MSSMQGSRRICRIALALSLPAMSCGCGATRPNNAVPADQFSAAIPSVRSEPWALTGRFASWRVAHVTADARDYTQPGAGTTPDRGPILISEIIPRGDPATALSQVAAQYTSRPNGRVGRVWVDEPGVYVFEGFYDAVIRQSAIPFHDVVRLSPMSDPTRLAVLTYTRRTDDLGPAEVSGLVTALQQQTLR